MTAVLNDVIGIGGTSAHETMRSKAQVLGDCIAEGDVISCQLAEDSGGLLGFQSVSLHPALTRGWGDIGTCVKPGQQRGGVGRALWEATRAAEGAVGIITINAPIRADNAPGLGYYTRLGFVDDAQDPDFALQDGRVMGRVSKRHDLL